jgi:hypothetical protein
VVRAGLFFCCPCGCGEVGALHLKPLHPPSWKWNGNLTKPTLYPSIALKAGGQTHVIARLVAGNWNFNIGASQPQKPQMAFQRADVQIDL